MNKKPRPSTKFQVARQRQDMQTPSKSNHDFLLKLELRSHPQLLSAVRGSLEPLMETLGFSAEDCRAIVRAVDEAVSNIMRHSYSGRPDQPIELYVNRLVGHGNSASEPGVEIVLVDSGLECDTTKIEARPLDEVKPGGLGLHIIRGSMDSVEYIRDGDRNRLRLVKYARPPKAGPNP